LPTPKLLLTLPPRRTKPQKKPQPKRFDRNLNQWRQRLPQAQQRRRQRSPQCPL